jgi:hypothetical protein
LAISSPLVLNAGKAISQISHDEIEIFLLCKEASFGTSLVKKKSEDPRIKVLSASKKATFSEGAIKP